MELLGWLDFRRETSQERAARRKKREDLKHARVKYRGPLIKVSKQDPKPPRDFQPGNYA